MHDASTRSFNWFLIGSYVAILSLLLWRHEMWRDELHTWTIVTQSDSLTGLLYNKRYEGHPALWYVLLWPFSRLSTQPIILQWVHGMLAVSTASLIVFRSPFTRWEKALLVWGYYLLYEYGVISRNYQLGLLLAFGLMAIWPLALRNPVLLGVGLALLFQTSAFGILLGLGIGAAYLINLFQTKQLLRPQVLGASILVLLGLLSAYLAMRTPSDLTYQVPFNWHWNATQAQLSLATLYQGLLPLPEIGSLTFWNTNSLTNYIGCQAFLSVICALAIMRAFRHDWVSLVLFGVTALLIFLFAYTSYAGSVRHNGHYMIALLCSYWLYRQHKEAPRQRRPLPILLLFLVVQGFAGLYATYMDGRYAFSMARPLVNYLKRNYPADVIVAGSYNNLLTPVAGYLGRDVYTLSTNRYGSYVLWNEANWNRASLTMPDSALFARYLQFQRQYPNSVLVMAYQPFSHPDVQEGSVYNLHSAGKEYRFQCTAAFQPAIVPDENYYIFQLKADTSRIH